MKMLLEEESLVGSFLENFEPFVTVVSVLLEFGSEYHLLGDDCDVDVEDDGQDDAEDDAEDVGVIDDDDGGDDDDDDAGESEHFLQLAAFQKLPGEFVTPLHHFACCLIEVYLLRNRPCDDCYLNCRLRLE